MRSSYKIERYRWDRANSDNVREEVFALATECKTDSDIKTLWEDRANTEFWLVRTGGLIVGFACLTLLNCTEAYFSNAAIHEYFRGIGLHGRLIKARLKWCEEHGILSATTYTTRDNYASANNLIRAGFELVSKSPSLDRWYGKPMASSEYLLWARSVGR